MSAYRFESAVINIKLFNELEIILEAFEKADITVVPIKGAWLAQTVYSNIALRRMSDVDLWINRNQLGKARQIMCELGYSMHSSKDRPQELQDELLGETKMLKPGHTMVELHWKVFEGEWFRHTTRIDEIQVWNRTVPYNSEIIRQLSPEDAIIQICAHLSVSHQMSVAGLRTLLDLYFLIQKFDIDWSYIIIRSKEWQIMTMMWLVLSLIDQLFGGKKLKLPLLEFRHFLINQWILRIFISPIRIIKGVDISKGPKRFIFLLALVDKPSDVSRIIWRSLVPERKWLILRYGLKPESRWRVWLQYLLHILQIIIKKKI